MGHATGIMIKHAKDIQSTAMCLALAVVFPHPEAKITSEVRHLVVNGLNMHMMSLDV